MLRKQIHKDTESGRTCSGRSTIHTSVFCSTSMHTESYCIMTGRYPARTPVGLMEPIDFGDDSIGLTSESPSVAAILKKRGYKTVLVGKWHLGYGTKYSPKENGFDEFYGFKGGGVDYVSHTDPSGSPDLYRNDQIQEQEGYMTDLLCSHAVDFLKQEHTAPFFLSLQFSSPHWPWQARELRVPTRRSRMEKVGF